MATKKDAANTLVSGGVGFALGWFLHRPRAKMEITLSNLQITPSSGYAGDQVIISVDALNNSIQPVTATIVAHAVNTILKSTLILPPGQIQHIEWLWTAEDVVSSDKNITVSIEPLLGIFTELPAP